MGCSDDTETTVDEAVEAARGGLSEDKAVAVEQLFFQYVSYVELQKEIRSYYSSFLANNMSVGSTVQMRSEYYITSSIKDLDSILIRMAMTEADYQTLRDMIPDEEAGAAIYDRISFTTAKSTSNITVKMPVQEGEENAYLIHVDLYGSSEEQCREMMEVVEAAFSRETEKLKVLDPNIKVEKLPPKFPQNRGVT